MSDDLPMPKSREERRAVMMVMIAQYPNELRDNEQKLLLQCLFRELTDLNDTLSRIADKLGPDMGEFQPLNPKP